MGLVPFVTHNVYVGDGWYYHWQKENNFNAPYQSVTEVMFNMYLIRVDDWGCWLCSCSPPPAGSEAKVSPSSEALRVSVDQTGAPPSWQKVSPGSS